MTLCVPAGHEACRLTVLRCWRAKGTPLPILIRRVSGRYAQGAHGGPASLRSSSATGNILRMRWLADRPTEHDARHLTMSGASLARITAPVTDGAGGLGCNLAAGHLSAIGKPGMESNHPTCRLRIDRSTAELPVSIGGVAPDLNRGWSDVQVCCVAPPPRRPLAEPSCYRSNFHSPFETMPFRRSRGFSAESDDKVDEQTAEDWCTLCSIGRRPIKCICKL